MAGDDCFDFMQEFSEFFGVDLSAYDWSKYHCSEAEEMSFFGALRRMISLVSGRPDPYRPQFPISVAQLEKAVREKSWTDPNPMPPPVTDWIARLFGRQN